MGRALTVGLQISMLTKALPKMMVLKLFVLAGAKLRPILCNPMDCSPPGSSVHAISQAKILEWVVSQPTLNPINIHAPPRNRDLVGPECGFDFGMFKSSCNWNENQV